MQRWKHLVTYVTEKIFGFVRDKGPGEATTTAAIFLGTLTIMFVRGRVTPPRDEIQLRPTVTTQIVVSQDRIELSPRVTTKIGLIAALEPLNPSMVFGRRHFLPILSEQTLPLLITPGLRELSDNLGNVSEGFSPTEQVSAEQVSESLLDPSASDPLSDSISLLSDLALQLSLAQDTRGLGLSNVVETATNTSSSDTEEASDDLSDSDDFAHSIQASQHFLQTENSPLVQQADPSILRKSHLLALLKNQYAVSREKIYDQIFLLVHKRWPYFFNGRTVRRKNTVYENTSLHLYTSITDNNSLYEYEDSPNRAAIRSPYYSSSSTVMEENPVYGENSLDLSPTMRENPGSEDEDCEPTTITYPLHEGPASVFVQRLMEFFCNSDYYSEGDSYFHQNKIDQFEADLERNLQGFSEATLDLGTMPRSSVFPHYMEHYSNCIKLKQFDLAIRQAKNSYSNSEVLKKRETQMDSMDSTGSWELEISRLSDALTRLHLQRVAIDRLIRGLDPNNPSMAGR